MAPARRTRGGSRAGGLGTGPTRAGLRRVDGVRLYVGPDRTLVRAEVLGAGFRLPVTWAVPLPVAADLIGAGTPFVTRSVGAEA
jgi:hypothetical protein